MRRFYSFMLMATMLLIGTTAWAQYVAQIGNVGYTSLQAAVNAIPAGGTATIEILDDIALDAPVVIPQVETAATAADKVVNRAMQHITLDLGDNNTISTQNYSSAIILLKGELNIIGKGTIRRKSGESDSWKGSWDNFSASAIVVCGVDGDANDATNDRSKQEWSILTIGKDVTVESKAHSTNSTKGGYGIGIQNFNTFATTLDAYVHSANLGYQTYYTANTPLWWGGTSSGAAFGVKVIVAGKVKAFQRGINVVGTVNQSAKMVENKDKRISGEYPFYAHNYPYIRIEKGALVECEKDGLESGNGGIYAGGWAVIDILGTVQGQTGVLLKGGDAVVDGGTVKSTSLAEEAAANANYGGTVSGNAIFIASASNYAGATSISIEGGATIDTDVNGGAAIVDKVATNTATSSTPTVEHVEIVDGTIDGGISITDGTAANTHIINATVEDGITINGYPATNEQLSALVPGSTNIDENPEAEPDYNVTTPEAGTIKVEPNTAKLVTMNASGLATYSFDSETAGACRIIPDGVTAWVTTGAVENDILTLTPVTGNIPAGVGVILKGEANQEYTFTYATTGAATIDPAKNKLFAASTYQASYAQDENTHVYVLVGNELYKYTGSQMKANKAYLKLSNAATSYGAPRRIQMVFEETQDVENIEAGAKAVKFVENGKILIKRGEKVYNLQGQLVK